ncbi:MAG TPA: hypothetical protein VN041_11475 [Microbacterium sp.]|nr:hypothetical protein [Microbacterium sp.]
MSIDPTRPEEFAVGDAKQVIRNTLMTTGCLLIVAGVLLWFLIGVLLGMAGVGKPFGMILSILITLAIVALLLWLRAAQLRRNLSGAKLVAGPGGLEQHDDWGNVRFVAWNDIVEAGTVRPLKKDAKMVAGNPMAKAVGEAGVNALAAAAQSLGSAVGILGYGTVDFRRNGSPATRKAYADAFGAGPDGRALVGIQPSVFDADWQDGRVGEWIGHFRPDILAQARAEISRRNAKKGDTEGDAPSPAS